MACGLEPVVQAGPHDVGSEARAAGRQTSAAVDVTKIGIEIFELGSPIGDDRGLDAGTDRPADIGVACAGNAGLCRFHIAEGGAAGDVWQPAVKCPTDPAARGAEPVVLGLASE